MSSTWFVTGASRGLGRELAEQLLARGDRVVATCRRPEQLDDLREANGDRLQVRQLDVNDTASMRRVLAAAFQEMGHIDVVVSNAGYGLYGTAEDLSDEQVAQIMATNLIASIHLARCAVSHLREQGGGRLVQLSSMGAFVGFPAFSLYHATKWGIEGFFEALTKEVAPFGIQTVLVEPGMVRTGFYEATTRVPASEPYRNGPADRVPLPLEQMPGDQRKVVAVMIDAVLSLEPPPRLLLGSDAYRVVTTALADRLAAAKTQKAVAESTDHDAWTGQST